MAGGGRVNESNRCWEVTWRSAKTHPANVIRSADPVAFAISRTIPLIVSPFTITQRTPVPLTRARCRLFARPDSDHGDVRRHGTNKQQTKRAAYLRGHNVGAARGLHASARVSSNVKRGYCAGSVNNLFTTHVLLSCVTSAWRNRCVNVSYSQIT